jgi:hypothetical protein
VKKIVSILVIVLFVFMHVTAMGAGTAAKTTAYNSVFDRQDSTATRKVIILSITDDTAGTTATFSEDEVLGYWFCSMESIPNTTTPPTNDFDLTLSTAGGFDLLNGAGANLDSPTPNMVYSTIDSTTGQKGCVPVNSALTVDFSGNSVASGKIDVRFFFQR